MRAKRITLIAILVAIALVVSLLESYIPIPIPGVKIGISNIVLINGILLLGFRDSILIALLKSLLLVIILSSPTSFFYSFFGGVVSVTVMYLVNRYLDKIFSLVGVSVIGSNFHILSQIVVASVFLNTRVVFLYFPILGLVGVFTGILVGLISIRVYGILRGVYGK